MKMNEIFDPEDHKASLQRTMNRFARQYAPEPEDVVAARKEKNASSQEAARKYNERRKRIEMALEPIAQKYKGDQYEQFKNEAEATLDPEELKMIDLPFTFNMLNPEKIADNTRGWKEYGEQRAKGNNPQIHGMGPTGHRNWTGD